MFTYKIVMNLSGFSEYESVLSQKVPIPSVEGFWFEHPPPTNWKFHLSGGRQGSGRPGEKGAGGVREGGE